LKALFGETAEALTHFAASLRKNKKNYPKISEISGYFGSIKSITV
jgi:hypothetical protein